MKRLALFLVLVIPTGGPSFASQEDPNPGLPATPAPTWFGDASRRGDERTVVGQAKATEAGARVALRSKLGESVREWLHEGGIPRDWSPPERLVDALVRQTHVQRVDKEYGTLYVAADRVDFSADHAARFAEVYRREVVGRHLALLTGALGFVLVSLAGLAGYIRADEATKGYYTTNLRLIAAAVVGASGVVIYRMLA